MQSQRAIIALVLTNLLLVGYQFAQATPTRHEPVADVLRGRALELVDDKGRVRAEIKVLPADSAAEMPDGTRGYPEAVQLRLIDSKGSPHVKLVSSDDGSGLVLGAEKGYVQIRSRGTKPFVKILDGSERQRVIAP